MLEESAETAEAWTVSRVNAVTENEKGLKAGKKVEETKRREDEQRKESARADKEFKETKHGDREESKPGKKE